MRRLPVTIGTLLVGLACMAEAQERTLAQSDSLCATVIKARRLTGSSCATLATQIVDNATRLLYQPEPRDLQNQNAKAATGGSLAQAEAVPSVEPLAVGGASLAAVGADSGAKAIVALTLNPSIFLTSPRNAEQIARASRIADLTVLFPVDDLDRDKDGNVDYFGARLRLNITGSKSGGKIVKAGQAFLQAVQGEGEFRKRLIELFKAAANVETCVDALLAQEHDETSITEQCGRGALWAPDRDTSDAMRKAMAEARAEADSRYLGLDLRMDFGDPTLGAVKDASATSINAGLALGRQFLGANPAAATAGVKARLGVRYTDLKDLHNTSFAVDGGLGFEARRPLDQDQAAVLSAGFEFRYGGEKGVEEALQTNFTVFRAALAIPVAGATALSIAVGAPIDGPISPTLSVNFNWGLLLPKLGLVPPR
jgi:hypothetical protein